MKSNKIVVAAVLGIIFIGLVFFIVKSKNHSNSIQTNKLRVVTSFYPLYFMSSEIGGDKAEVTNITPVGAEPHDYEPTAQDLVKIESSKLIILNGRGLETWGEDIQKNIDPAKTLTITAGENLADKPITEDGKTVADPHVWLDPPLAEKMVDNITSGFIQADPVNKDYYASNAAALKSKLADLDAEYRQKLSSCAQKNIITSHTAFSYLAADYGLKQISIAGLSPDAEPSPQQLAEIAKFAKDNNVKYIFFESLVSPKLAETIAAEVGAKTLVLNPLEGLSDTELAAGKNYITVMQDNLTNLQIALQCQ